MIKRFFWVLIIIVLLPLGASSQVLKKVRWSTEVSQNEAKVGDEVELIFKAVIDPAWYIYSVDFEDCGPIPMTVLFEQQNGFELVGKLRAIKDKTKHDEIFGCDVRIFEKTGEFRQTIKISSAEAKVISGSFEGQVCSESEGLCVLFDGDFTFNLVVTGGKVESLKTNPKPVEVKEVDKQESIIPDSLPAANDVRTNTIEENYEENNGPILDR
jgi:thiol:disulfide interchange protein DsbD